MSNLKSATSGGAVHVIQTHEHGEIELDPALIFDGNQLLLDPAVEKAGYVAVALSGKKIRLKATSWVGFIPLNETLAVQVSPRVPISVMTELLEHVSADKHRLIELGLQGYGIGHIRPTKLLDLLARRLITLAKTMRLQGLDFVYAPLVRQGHSPVGNILPMPTKLRQARTGDRGQSVSSTWVKSVDTTANRMVLATLRRLYQAYAGLGKGKGAPVMRSDLAQTAAIFARVSVKAHRLDEAGLATLNQRVARRPEYVEASTLARAVFLNHGIDPTVAGSLTLHPVVVNLEDAFERFLRAKLSDALASHGLTVLDGNSDAPTGAQGRLYRKVKLSDAAKIPVKPDIVIRRGNRTVAVIDVKYKPYKGGPPERDDVEQVVTYAAVYRAPHAIVALPQRPTGLPPLIPIGKVGRTNISVLALDLNTTNLANEVTVAVQALLHRLGFGPTASGPVSTPALGAPLVAPGPLNAAALPVPTVTLAAPPTSGP